MYSGMFATREPQTMQSQSGLQQSQLLQRLIDKPFWIWNPQQHKVEDIRRGLHIQENIHGLYLWP